MEVDAELLPVDPKPIRHRSCSRSELLGRLGSVEEGRANVEARAVADIVPIRPQPILRGLPAKPLEINQEIDIGIRLAGDAEGAHLLLVADHVDVYALQSRHRLALEMIALDKALDKGDGAHLGDER